jgi:hypothetical protein
MTWFVSLPFPLFRYSCYTTDYIFIVRLLIVHCFITFPYIPLGHPQLLKLHFSTNFVSLRFGRFLCFINIIPTYIPWRDLFPYLSLCFGTRVTPPIIFLLCVYLLYIVSSCFPTFPYDIRSCWSYTFQPISFLYVSVGFCASLTVSQRLSHDVICFPTFPLVSVLVLHHRLYFYCASTYCTLFRHVSIHIPTTSAAVEVTLFNQFRFSTFR